MMGRIGENLHGYSVIARPVSASEPVEAIPISVAISGLLRFARNDGVSENVIARSPPSADTLRDEAIAISVAISDRSSDTSDWSDKMTDVHITVLKEMKP
jgi:hypothetical protein